MKKAVAMAVALLFVFSVVALHAETAAAQPAAVKTPGTKDPKINKHQKNQKKRIKQGVKNGQLTKEEAKKLKEEQKKIREKEKEMKADGTLTKEERKELKGELKEQSKEIYKEKHDGEKKGKK
jgi:peptidoglycan hydrolase CwlO-like protein